MNGLSCGWRLVAGAIVLLSASATGQAQGLPRVTVLTLSQSQWQENTFRETLAGLGHRDGGNIRIDVRSAEGDFSRLSTLAEAAVRERSSVIVAVNTPGTVAARKATTTIPIVAAIVADPVALGFIKSMARPEGNVTGVSNMAIDLTAKRISLLQEVVPTARRIALFVHPDEQPVVRLQMKHIDAAASRLNIEHRQFSMRNVTDLNGAIQAARSWGAHAIVRLAGQAYSLGTATGKLATESKLPSMMVSVRDVEAGALMSYFAEERALWRRIASHVDRILKGAKPSDLPFEQPTVFELSVNLRTAKTLGVRVPASILVAADKVIE